MKNDFKQWLEINKEFLYKDYCSKYPEDFEDYARMIYKLDREIEC